MKQFLFFVILFFVTAVHGQPTVPDMFHSTFFPFGLDQGDDVLFEGDGDISVSIHIPIRFPYFNHKYDRVKIKTNGKILFCNQSYEGLSYIPRRFPVDEIICVAPRWSDIIKAYVIGYIFYRQIVDKPTLNELDQIVKKAFPGRAAQTLVWAFIVTWHEVTGFLLPNLDSTFQAIFATNGINSFLIFNYDKFQWMIDAASESVPIQTRFNASYVKNYFPIDRWFKSKNAELANDSYVAYPDRSVFSIGSNLTNVDCNTLRELQTVPFRGSPDGGYEIRLFGICFKELNYTIKVDQNILNDCNVTLIDVTCIMPMIYNGPIIEIQVVTMENVLVATTNFLIDIPEDNSELLIENVNVRNSFIDMSRNDSIKLRFKNNFITKNYQFNVQLFSYETIFTENYELVNIIPHQHVLYSSIHLSSLETLTIKYDDIFTLTNTRYIHDDIEITLLKLTFKLLSTESITPKPLRWLYREVHWTANAVKRTVDFCEKWESKIPQMPAPSTYESQVPQCPCRVPATGLNRFPLSFNSFQTDSSCNDHRLVTCTDDTEVSHCYRRSFEPVGPGIKCCYNTDGIIIKNPKFGPGGLEVQANSGASRIQQIKHTLFDQLPFWACCELPRMSTKDGSKSCAKYHRERPSFECENVPLPVPSGGNGDPHFTTLDGADYTFNGYGEYVLLRADTHPNSKTLEIQIRTKSVQSDSDDHPATAIVGFVIKNGNYSKVQFELFQELKLLNIRLNDQSIDSNLFWNSSIADADNNEVYQILMTMSRTIRFDNNQLSITQINQTIFKITYSNYVQFIIQIRKQYDFLNIVTILPKFYEGHCQGLLGNMDGDKTNDFIFQDGQTFLSPVEQQNEERLFAFGESWRVTAETTLFAYTSGENYHTQQNLHYRPVFQAELFRQYANTLRLTMAQQSCQKILSDHRKKQCIYDILITNDRTMSELHHDFQTNLNEWKEYAQLVQKDQIMSERHHDPQTNFNEWEGYEEIKQRTHAKNTGLMLAISNNTMIFVIIIKIIGFLFH